MKLIPRDEATRVRRLGDVTRWPELVELAKGDELDRATAFDFLAALYAAGYAVVRLEPGERP